MRSHFTVLLIPLFLTACIGNIAMPTNDPGLTELLKNPLYAEYYYDDLTNQMVQLALQQHPIMKEPGVREVVDRTRMRSLEHAAVAVSHQRRGTEGKFLSDREVTFGDALLLDDVLYFGPTFDTAPGPKLSVYLTTVVDPRDTDFPDETAIRLGLIKDNYGAQSHVVPEDATGTGKTLRTVVVWDDELSLLYGFVQLTPGN